MHTTHVNIKIYIAPTTALFFYQSISKVFYNYVIIQLGIIFCIV